MNKLILLAMLMVNTIAMTINGVAPSPDMKITVQFLEADPEPYVPYLVLRAQDPVDGMVYGWCVDEKGWHEFEAESAKDYLKAGFRACKEAQ